jgi:SAM-dependent methyltransferase
VTSAFDAYRLQYDAVVQDSIAFSGLKHDFFLEAKLRLLAEIFAARLGPVRPALLDVGCGVGLLHPGLLPLTRSLAGTDISHEALARAETENPSVAYRPQDGNHLSFESASFDVSLAVCVLHHVPAGERETLVQEMRRVTRPGGLVIVIEHNPWNPLTRLAVARCPFDRDAELLQAAEGRRLLRAAGLRQVESRHFLLFPSLRRWPRRVESALSAVPLGAQYLACGTA